MRDPNLEEGDPNILSSTLGRPKLGDRESDDASRLARVVDNLEDLSVEDVVRVPLNRETLCRLVYPGGRRFAVFGQAERQVVSCIEHPRIARPSREEQQRA